MNDKPVILINVFTVDPERQLELIELLTRATEDSVRHARGFMSAWLHRSLDGTKVTMYAQWRTEDYQAMRCILAFGTGIADLVSLCRISS
jgi:quinol monooxygenase YgiN